MKEIEMEAVASRRRWLRLGVAAAGTAALAASAARPDAAPAREVAVRLTAQTTEGPYYFDPELIRSDITEGLAGVPLEIRLTVLDETGAPFPQAQVDIWHCNASGVYSGYAGQGDDRRTDTRGRTFLRGRLATGGDGVAAFRSIYPGWYEGRATHIHFKVLNGRRAVLTSQFFLPDALSEYLYTELPDYRRQQLRDTLNSNDGIAIEAGDTVSGAVQQFGDRYVVSLTVGVDRLADPVAERPPGPDDALPPGPPPGAGMPFDRGPHRLDRAARLEALVPGRSLVDK